MPAENGYAGYVNDIEVSLETWIQTLTSLFIGLWPWKSHTYRKLNFPNYENWLL